MLRTPPPKRVKIIPITELNYSIDRQQHIRALVTKLRHARGKTNTNNHNISFKSINANHGLGEDLNKLGALLTDPLYMKHRNFRFPKVHAARLMLRYRPNISSEYAKQQTLHIDAVNNPVEGIVFAQFIYYIDTPQMGGVNAPEKEAGALLLNPINSSGKLDPSNTTIVQPKKGRIIFFDPSTTLHEVIAPKGRNTGNVSRNMIIGILYRAPDSNIKQNNSGAGVQLRPSKLHTRMTRHYAGTLRPSVKATNANINSLSKLLGMTKVSMGIKRKLSNNMSPYLGTKRIKKV